MDKNIIITGILILAIVTTVVLFYLSIRKIWKAIGIISKLVVDTANTHNQLTYTVGKFMAMVLQIKANAGEELTQEEQELFHEGRKLIHGYEQLQKRQSRK